MGSMVVLQGKSNSGKTSTLRELAKYLIDNYSSTNEVFLEGRLKEYDFIVKIEVNNKIVVIISMGDNEELKRKLDLVFNKFNKIDVLFGACRTKGVTVMLVKSFSKKHGLDLIMASTYRNKAISHKLNTIKAKELNDLMHSLNLV